MSGPRKPKPSNPGWVIRHEVWTRRKGDDAPRRHVSWWYGPDHGWGATYGSIVSRGWVGPAGKRREGAYVQDRSVRVWRTRREAEVAWRAHGGQLGPSTGVTVQRVADAIDQAWEGVAAYHARLAAS